MANDFDAFLTQQREDFLEQLVSFQEYLSHDAEAVVFTSQYY